MIRSVAGGRYGLADEIKLSVRPDVQQGQALLAKLQGGGFVAVWQEEATFGTNWVTYQRFNADGEKVGGQVLLREAYLSGLVTTAEGGFAITYAAHDYPGGAYDFRMQRFDAGGQGLGSEISLAPAFGGQVTTLADGGFVVLWSQFPDYSHQTIRGQIYSAAGEKVGTSFIVAENLYLPYDTVMPAEATALPNGNFVVTWTVYGDFALNPRSQIYDAAANAVGATIANQPAGTHFGPTAALPDGNFLMVWSAFDSTPAGLRYAVYDVGSGSWSQPVQVDRPAYGYSNYSPTVVVTDDGPVFFWMDGEPAGSKPANHLSGQAFDFAGNKVGTEFTLGSDTAQWSPASIRLQNGAIVIAYDGGPVEATMLFPVVRGSELADSFSGTEGRDFYSGNGGDDAASGAGGADFLDGNAGSDRLDGGSGDDNLDGGAGDDVLTGGAGKDVLAGDDGDDILFSDAADPAYHGNFQRGVSYDVTSEPDTLNGGAGNDVIFAGYGDTVDGGANEAYGDKLNISFRAAPTGVLADFRLLYTQGSVTIGGGTIAGIEEVGFIEGSEFDDMLAGAAISAYPVGNAIYGRGGNDRLIAGYYAGWGGTGLYGGDGDDVIDLRGAAYGPGGHGDSGNDRIIGGASGEYLDGGDGDDVLSGGAGIDSFDGGADDGLENADSGYGDKVSFYERTATQGVLADLRTGTISNDGFGNVESMSGIESLGAGTRFADTFYGNDGRNYLSGSLGDTLKTFGGDDIVFLDSKPEMVDGGDGVDELRLGTGGGWLTADADGDGLADIAAASSVGWLVNLADHVLSENSRGAVLKPVFGIENVIGSSLADNLAGDDGDNLLKGGDGNDQLSGRGGNDRLEGGAGSDSLRGGAGDDQLFGGDGDDVMSDGPGVDSFDGGNNGPGIPGYFTGDQLTFGGIDTAYGVVADLRTGIIANDGYGNVETVVGVETLFADNPFADTLYGDDGKNYLFGAVGDTLKGFGGDDRIHLAAAGAVDGGAGWDKLEVSSDGLFTVFDLNGDGVPDAAPAMTVGWTVNLAAGTLTDGYGNSGTVAGIEQVLGSHLADTLIGDAFDNRLEGDSGNDVFDLSTGGNDYVLGGLGNDYFYFGAAFTAGDTVDGRGPADTDTVGLLGNYNLTLGANTLLGVETLSLLSGTAAGGTEHVTYSITTVDANVPAGGRLTVYAGGLLADESLFFNGYAETDGALSVYGGAGNDTFAGGPANDAFVGGAGNDLMYGLGGNDWLEGGPGADGMRGGVGNDVFVYQSAAESTAAATDHIFDFEDISDHISLTNVDANTNAAGDQAFTFISGNAFSHTAGELRAYQSGSSWFVEGDVNGDGTADLVIQVDTFGGHAMTASDFYL